MFSIFFMYYSKIFCTNFSNFPMPELVDSQRQILTSITTTSQGTESQPNLYNRNPSHIRSAEESPFPENTPSTSSNSEHSGTYYRTSLQLKARKKKPLNLKPSPYDAQVMLSSNPSLSNSEKECSNQKFLEDYKKLDAEKKYKEITILIKNKLLSADNIYSEAQKIIDIIFNSCNCPISKQNDPRKSLHDYVKHLVDQIINDRLRQNIEYLHFTTQQTSMDTSTINYPSSSVLHARNTLFCRPDVSSLLLPQMDQMLTPMLLAPNYNGFVGQSSQPNQSYPNNYVFPNPNPINQHMFTPSILSNIPIGNSQSQTTLFDANLTREGTSSLLNCNTINMQTQPFNTLNSSFPTDIYNPNFSLINPHLNNDIQSALLLTQMEQSYRSLYLQNPYLFWHLFSVGCQPPLTYMPQQENPFRFTDRNYNPYRNLTEPPATGNIDLEEFRQSIVTPLNHEQSPTENISVSGHAKLDNDSSLSTDSERLIIDEDIIDVETLEDE